MKTMRWVVAGVVAGLVAVVSGCSGTGEAAIAYPASQQEFFSMNNDCKAKYATGQNDIQKSLVFNQCNKDRLRFSKDQNISGWVGEVTDISTDQGADVVSVTITTTIDGFESSFGTVNNRISDYATDSMITQSNPLFNVLAQMKEGDRVSFDGRFLPHPESQRGIWESSMTEHGSMDEPEFMVRFSDIRPYGADSNAVATSRVGVKVAQSNANTSESSEPESPIGSGESSDEPAADPAPDVDFASLNGMGYGAAKLLLKKAGYTPENGVDRNAFPHDVDGDDANCGNVGCSIQWVQPSNNKHLCVGVTQNDDVPQSEWKSSAETGACQ
jgi:hypothetical protein